VLILEILCCDPKGHRALLRVPSTEGRGVRLCWAISKPKEPKGFSTEQFPVSAYVGSSKNEKDLKGPASVPHLPVGWGIALHCLGSALSRQLVRTFVLR
jgi:hypothetical protein